MKVAQQFSFLIALMLWQCSAPYQGSFPTYNDPAQRVAGKCYAKCQMPESVEKVSEEYYVYTGDPDSEVVDIEEINIEVKPAVKKWVKGRKPDCDSSEEDCTAWQLIELPAEYRRLTILKDTTQSKNFNIERISFERTTLEGDISAVVEVLCELQCTDQLIFQVQSTLIKSGYLSTEHNSNQLDKPTWAAIRNYQKEQGLPIGYLNIPTLDYMRINY